MSDYFIFRMVLPNKYSVRMVLGQRVTGHCYWVTDPLPTLWRVFLTPLSWCTDVTSVAM